MRPSLADISVEMTDDAVMHRAMRGLSEAWPGRTWQETRASMEQTKHVFGSARTLRVLARIFGGDEDDRGNEFFQVDDSMKDGEVRLEFQKVN